MRQDTADISITRKSDVIVITCGIYSPIARSDMHPIAIINLVIPDTNEHGECVGRVNCTLLSVSRTVA